MTKRGGAALMKIFDEPIFAWDLLEWEMAIEMNESVSGKAIAKLLELYMKGVEKMNSFMDVRQSYFKNKVTSLMMRSNVVKTLSKPPMSKKSKPLQTQAKTEEKPHKAKAKNKAKVQVNEEEPTVSTQQSNLAKPYNLQQKRRQIQMRLAFQSHEHSKQNLSKIYQKVLVQEFQMMQKIITSLNDNERKLQERINSRKLKTITIRSRPQNTNDTSTKPIDTAEQYKNKQENIVNQFNSPQKKSKDERKLMKSLENIGTESSKSTVKISRKHSYDDSDLDSNKQAVSIQTLKKSAEFLLPNQAL